MISIYRMGWGGQWLPRPLFKARLLLISDASYPQPLFKGGSYSKPGSKTRPYGTYVEGIKSLISKNIRLLLLIRPIIASALSLPSQVYIDWCHLSVKLGCRRADHTAHRLTVSTPIRVMCITSSQMVAYRLNRGILLLVFMSFKAISESVETGIYLYCGTTPSRYNLNIHWGWGHPYQLVLKYALMRVMHIVDEGNAWKASLSLCAKTRQVILGVLWGIIARTWSRCV